MLSSLRNNLRHWQFFLLLLVPILATAILLWLLGKNSPAASENNLDVVKDSTLLAPPPAHRRETKTVEPDSDTMPSQTAEQSPTAVSDELDSQIHIIQLQRAEDYWRMMDWASANGFRITGQIPRLFTIRLALSDEEYRRLHHDSGLEFTEETEVFVSIPDQLLDKYPEWIGNPGPAFGTSYQDYLGVDTADTERGHGIIIALLDTALLPHSEFDNASLTKVARRNNGEPAATGTSDHGTAVASILTSLSNASILAYEVLGGETDSGSAFDLANAIVDAVDRGADIISMSLGTYSDSAILQNAIDYALEKQVIVVAAAGNNGVEEVCYPAAYDGVLAVGAIDANGNVSGFSNSGEEISLVAPGVGLLAATYDDEYAYFSGTSAAVPCVSAVLANYLAENPNADILDAYMALLQNCNDTEAPGKDTLSGFGILDAERLAAQTATGIRDAAAAGITLEGNTLTVSAQNTGTVLLEQLVLTTKINGIELQNTFDDVAPGTVVSAQGEVPEELLNGALPLAIRTTVFTPGVTDTRPRNQSHIQTFGEH